jgi:adenine-specific DNA-methyltransferase
MSDEVAANEATSEDGELNEAAVEEVDEDADTQEWEVRHARRRGGGAESSSFRLKRWGQFYPIYIDEANKRVVSAGKAIPLGEEPSFERVNGLRPIWPIDTAGQHRVWAFIPTSMQKLIDEDRVFLGRYHKKRDDWTINYRVPLKKTRKLKTVWWEKSHDAGTHGTNLLTKILGRPGLFPFPKSARNGARLAEGKRFFAEPCKVRTPFHITSIVAIWRAALRSKDLSVAPTQ